MNNSRVEQFQRHVPIADSEDISAENMAEVLPQVVNLNTGSDSGLANALAPVIDKAIQISIEENPSRITDINFSYNGASYSQGCFLRTGRDGPNSEYVVGAELNAWFATLANTCLAGRYAICEVCLVADSEISSRTSIVGSSRNRFVIKLCHSSRSTYSGPGAGFKYVDSCR